MPDSVYIHPANISKCKSEQVNNVYDVEFG